MTNDEGRKVPYHTFVFRRSAFVSSFQQFLSLSATLMNCAGSALALQSAAKQISSEIA
jgi:hypothetical protein